jgi:hypothetical protein
MTRFVGEAVGDRKRTGTYTSSARKRDLDAFLETGVHPALERAAAAAAAAPPPRPLPPRRPGRAHVYLRLAVAAAGASRAAAAQEEPAQVLIELFDDVAPAAAAALRARLEPPGGGGGGGAAAPLAGAPIHRLLPGIALFTGRADPRDRRGAPRVAVRRCAALGHAEAGAVSIALDGGEVCFALAAAPHLDADWQVAGRVAGGLEALLRVSDAGATAPDDVPRLRAVIARCGVADADGGELSGGAGGGAAATPAAAAAAARAAAEAARGAVVEACAAGLARRAEGGGGGGGGGAARALDALLGGGSGSSSSEDEGAGAGD